MAKKVLFSARPNLQTASPPTPEQWVNSGSTNGGSLKRLTIDVPRELHVRVKTQCAAKGLKMADEIRVLLEKHFPVA